MKPPIVLFALAILVFQLSGQQRIPLIEEFSASTCPPCKTFNDNVFNPFLNTANLQGKYTVVNYRANWPGSGDPYYTAEAGTRISYYGVNSVPSCFMDGTSATYNSLSSFTSNFNTKALRAPRAVITSQFQVTGTTTASAKVITTVIVTPTADISNASLYVAAVEKVTIKNASTNGEKEFHFVMMKMIPNASGRPLTLKANTEVTVIDSASLAGTKFEEMTDIAVAAWVQISGTREVLQSVMSVAQSTPVINRCLLNGCSSGKQLTRISGNAVTNAQNSLITVNDLSGREIMRVRSSSKTFHLNALRLSRGCYILKVGQGSQAMSELFSITK
jgi:hypothetical protein